MRHTRTPVVESFHGTGHEQVRGVSRPIWTEVVSQQLYDYELDWHETTNLATNSSYDRMMAELLAQMKEGFEE